MITLRHRNPQDGIDSFTQLRVYRATSETGTYTLLITVSLDITTFTEGYYGYTQYIDSAGNDTYFYKFSYYNPTTLTESSLTSPLQGGTTELDAKIRRRLKDTNSGKYFFLNNEIQDARDFAIQHLYPNTWMEKEYDVLITTSNKAVVTVPSYIKRIDKITMYDENLEYAGILNGYTQTANKLYALDEFPTGYTLRIAYTKKYQYSEECPEEFDSHLVDVASLELLKTMELDRSRYYKYTTSIRPEGGNLPSLSNIIERLEKTTRDRRNDLRRARKVVEINLVNS